MVKTWKISHQTQKLPRNQSHTGMRDTGHVVAAQTNAREKDWKMSKITPIAVGESSAARMLDFRPAEFSRLVEVGAMPPPVMINGFARWRVRDLEAILNGDAARPAEEDFEI